MHCGKSTIVAILKWVVVVQIIDRLGLKCKSAAPVGRSAFSYLNVSATRLSKNAGDIRFIVRCVIFVYKMFEQS